jgi:hypothetical protein
MKNHLIPLTISFISESMSASPDTVRRSLETTSAKWFGYLQLSGYAVAFGCLLEVWETAVSLRNWLRARRGYHINENPKSWGIPIAAFGLLLVVGGIVAETAFEGLSSNADTAIRSHESDVLSDAETKAGIANERAQRLEAANIDLHSQVKKARAEADAFAHDILSAKQQAAKAENDLASALERTKKLEGELAWRTVTPEQKTELRKLLSASTGSVLPLAGLQITFEYTSSDPEAEEYADELNDAMEGLGAVVIPPTGMEELFGPGKAPQGVTVSGNPAVNLKADLLLRALTDSGIAVIGRLDQNLDARSIRIVVRHKPRK